jgi:hypothetical protein
VVAFYLDEDSQDGDLVAALRRAGLDVLTTAEAGRNGESDDSQLAYASSISRMIATANRGHFARLHRETWQQGRSHAGIVVWDQGHSIGERLRGLLSIADAYQHEPPTSRIEFLSNWLE